MATRVLLVAGHGGCVEDLGVVPGVLCLAVEVVSAVVALVMEGQCLSVSESGHRGGHSWVPAHRGELALAAVVPAER